MPNLIPIFLTGLLTGGITCMAVQGGLLTTVMAVENRTNPPSLPTSPFDSAQGYDGQRKLRGASASLVVFLFVGAKIVSYTILGFLLGLLGSAIGISLEVSSITTILLSLFMIGIGFNMLHVHPFFRYFTIAPPKILRRFIWSQSKRQDMFAPIFLGMLTVFIPCGTTEVMMAEAVRYGNPLAGALILFAFTLGTAPLFIILGLSLGTLSEAFQEWFRRIAALFIIGMACVNIYTTTLVLGVMQPIEFSSGRIEQTATTVHPTITIHATSYEVDNPSIKAGQQITLTLKNIDGGGCIQSFTIPSLGIRKTVSVGKEETVTFTAPNNPGVLWFMCSMGMYRGKFIVQ